MEKEISRRNGVFFGAAGEFLNQNAEPIPLVSALSLWRARPLSGFKKEISAPKLGNSCLKAHKSGKDGLNGLSFELHVPCASANTCVEAGAQGMILI